MKLCIPPSILDQHCVVLGKTGAGKSSALRHIVEYLLRHKKRVCIIDPKGDWWGLKSSADGKAAGFSVIAFGDFKESRASDVPINAQSGRHVAELITSGNRPCIIGFRGWMTAHMVQFWIDFASGVFNANSGELYLVGDEFHNFAPKGRIQDPQAGKCLHWSNRLMSEGRGLGIVCLIASQRPQKVHNDTLTSCETLVAMRVVHKADRDAVKGWIEGCGDMEQGREVLNELAGMARGEAYVWSPENGFGPERVKFPMFETFDSFAPPQLQKRVDQQGWADVDLEAVKVKLAKVIEEAKASDPSELRKEISRLRSELAKKPKAELPAVPAKPVEIQVFSDKDKATLAGISVELETVGSKLCDLKSQVSSLFAIVSRVTPKPAPVAHRPVPKQAVRHQQRPVVQNGDWSPSKCARAILTVLAQFGSSNRRKVALVSGYSGKSGGFNNSLSELRSHGCIRGDSNLMEATDTGLEYLGAYDPIPTGDALGEYWVSELGACPAKILQYLLSIYPETATRQMIGEATGYSMDSGGFNNSLSQLRTLELIDDLPDRTIAASNILRET